MPPADGAGARPHRRVADKRFTMLRPCAKPLAPAAPTTAVGMTTAVPSRWSRLHLMIGPAQHLVSGRYREMLLGGERSRRPR